MIKLIGILVVALGFALRFNTLLVVMVAGIATGLAAGMSFNEIMELFGKYFIENRYMTLTVVLMLPVVGLLERYGLRERAETIVRRSKAATAGKVLVFYTAVRQISIAFGVNIGGHAAMVRPLVAPMAEAAARWWKVPLPPEEQVPARPARMRIVGSENWREITQPPITETTVAVELPAETIETIRAHAAAAENIGNFFGEDTVFAVGAVLLIQGTLHAQGYDVGLWALSLWGIPTAFVAFGLLVWRARVLDRKIAQSAAKPEAKK